MIAEAIKRIVDGADLTRDEMRTVFGEVMDGEASDAQKSALLVALRMKGESMDEVTGAAEAMRERVNRIDIARSPLVDTCGTGGDASGTFNVSTIAAIVASAAGAVVAKHGNRAVSSKCGSADLFAGLGLEIDLAPQQAAKVLQETGIAFLFAPRFHPAMKAVAGVRRELGLRTIFNVLGPLTNPAFAKRQVLGVFASELTEMMAGVLRSLGSEHALVVHSDDGMDEISISSATAVAELKDGEIRSYRLLPEEIGVVSHDAKSLKGGDVETNVGIARDVLSGVPGGPHEMVCANAGAALYVSGISESIAEGVTRARETIGSGEASARLEQLIEAASQLGGGEA